MPSRIIFRPPPGSGFADSTTSGTYSWGSPGSWTGATVGPGVVGAPEGVLLQSGLGVIPVPPGKYKLFVTRGPEYEAVERDVTVGPGTVQKVDVQLDHSVDTRGWMSADLHVHMKGSFDSRLPHDRRMISEVSNGVKLIVTTDHYAVVDAAPLLRDLGYAADVAGAISGNELNFNPGHAGVYPVPYDATKPGGGTPPYQSPCTAPIVGTNCMPDVNAFPYFHSLIPNQTVVTINHPWWPNGDLGYFTNIKWGAGTSNPLPASLASAGLFDALELLNGYWTRGDAEAALLADWFYLISQGHRVTALGSSDTHRINWVRAGWPRSWLRLPTDRPGDVDGATLADAIRNHRVIASTGPFVLLTVDGAQIGDTVVPATAGQVTVAISVDAPQWINVDTVHLYVNGQRQMVWPVTPGKRPLFQTTSTIAVPADSWIVALASGSLPLPPDVVGEYSTGNGYQMLPWAITNPIYVDADGDGSWTPPPWSGPPMTMPQFRHPLGRERPRPDQVPVDCEPGAVDTEPPLDALSSPEQQLMPLLYP
jgi:hypothetical protein